MQIKHIFDTKAFRRQRVPLLLLAMLPSLLIDIYLAFEIASHQNSFLVPTQIRSIWDAAAPFAANFMLLKAPAVFAHFKFRRQRLGSFVCVDENRVVYRKSKMNFFAKLDHGYSHHDEFHFKSIESVKRRNSGTIFVCGDILVFRKVHGTEAVSRQWNKKRMAIPAYYKDIDGVADKMVSMANAKTVV